MENRERDLRDLVFGDDLAATPETELQSISSQPERSAELSRLLNLRETLLSLGEEEPPRRTVLVASEIPARWWQRVLGLGSPGWGMAAACALAAAIVFHAVWQPMTATPATGADTMAEVRQEATSSPAAPEPEQVQQQVDALVNARLDQVVMQVREQLREEHRAETQRLVAAAEQRMERRQNEEMYAMREAVSYFQKKYGRQLLATNAALASEVQ